MENEEREAQKNINKKHNQTNTRSELQEEVEKKWEIANETQRRGTAKTERYHRYFK